MSRLQFWIAPMVFLGISALSEAYARDNPWALFKSPAEGPPRAFGDYSAGCVQGARPLPLNGDGYQVMHPNRRRYFGHPDLVSFIETLGHAVKDGGLSIILVGDLSQPRGGRATGGHASHETGLDVDLWYWYPKAAETRLLTQTERERTKARSILDAKTASVQRKRLGYVLKVLRLTAEDKRVERIFVHPIIKRDLCKQTEKDRDWLKKIRPWHGHDDHFHVRLSCPQDSADCTPQSAVPAGDGCDQLEWWFSDRTSDDRGQALKAYQTKVVSEPKLPPQCYQMLKVDKQDSNRSTKKTPARESNSSGTGI
jgi:penicillin-insensitive murein endopeptidase